MTKSILLLSLLFCAAASAFVPATSRSAFARSVVNKSHHDDGNKINGNSNGAIFMGGADSSSSSSSTTASATDFLKQLLPSLSAGNGGQKLLAASSDSWRSAIFKAVGAPETANKEIVAKALQDAMSKADNQFAILMGKAEPFVATFPSDVVDYRDDGTAWVECRLRHVDTDDLLVTMGIDIQQTENGEWLISSLDWQDFRDQFYPGLSGREWLRSF